MPTIVHISDLHFSDIEPGSADALVAAVNGASPDLVVVSGDLTLSGRRREFVDARRFLGRVERPLLVVPGNHDVPYNPLWRFTRPMGRFRAHVTRNEAPTIVGPEMCAMGLNTARAWDLSWNWSHGRFSDRQVRRADEFFGAHVACPFKCLVAHHPFFIPDGLRGFRIVGNAPRMLEVLGRRGVDIVLAGHLHQGFWRAHEHVAGEHRHHLLVIQASTATSHRRRDQPNAFNHLVIGAGTLTLTPWTRDSGPFLPQTSTSFERSPHGWALAKALV